MKKSNFRWIIYVILCAVILPLACVFISPSDKAFSFSSIEITKTEEEVTEISGDFEQTRVFSNKDVLSFLDNFKETLNFSSSDEALVLDKCIESKYGKVYRYNQYINGIKVYGGQLSVSTSVSGKISSILGSYYINLNYEKESKYSISEAESFVKDYYKTDNVSYLETNIIKTESTGYIAYIFEVKLNNELINVFVGSNTLNITKEIEKVASATVKGLPSEKTNTLVNEEGLQVLIDGKVVDKNLPIDKYVDSSGKATYVLGDKEKNIYVADGKNKKDYSYELYTSSTGVFEDEEAVKAYENLLICYDYYKDNFNIQGLTNNKTKVTLIAIVHFDNNYENAGFTIGEEAGIGYFIFGDGNAVFGTKPFMNPLDIVGHEYQHAITDSIVYLEYLNASGAINESFSDIFGACIEGYDLTDPRFWTMGEAVYIDGISSFRDMSNPGKYGDTTSFKDLYPYCNNHNSSHSGCDNGGVHVNSTLLTYATYLMYRNNPATFNKETIIDLWYETLLNLSTNADFEDFASVMMSVAKNRLELSEQNLKIIEYSFAAIDLPGYEGVKTWNNNTLQVLQGTGNIVDPYKINSEADLASFAYYINNIDNLNAFYPSSVSRESYLTARYEITSNLDLEEIKWVSIGTSKYPFNGVFNGGGYTINGLNISGNTNDFYAGLFGYTGNNSFIYDVRIGEGTVVAKAKYTGAIVGRLNGSLTSCSSELNIIGDYVGGLVGQVVNNNGGDKITSSYLDADLEGNVVGGIVASFATPKNSQLNLHTSGYIAACYSKGTLTGEMVGGIVAEANAIHITNCISLATIQDQSDSSILAGIVAHIQSKDIRNPEEVIGEPVSNYILGCKSANEFNKRELTKAGLIVCEVDAEIGKSLIYIEKTIAKEKDNLEIVNTIPNQPNIKIKDSFISSDAIFEGDFDFDNENYYLNKNNWIILEGIEGFDFISTFKIDGENKMPTFRNPEYWLNSYAYNFNGGTGTESDPYQIATAEQLALLSQLMSNDIYYDSASIAHYVLTNDIDLAGKVWMGIGLTKIYVDEEAGTSSSKLYAFRGVFDGAGHTIYNMNAISGYSLLRTPNKKTSYTLYEYLPALFGTTCIYYNGVNYVKPVIKNVTIDTINNRGSYASGIISKAYFGVDLENVTVMDGTISSSYIAGGLIGFLAGTGENLLINELESKIDGCYVLADINGSIVGGAIGYITNASNSCYTTVNIINFLSRVTIRVVGEDYETTVSDGSINYYKPLAGGVVGLTLVRNLNIINAVILGDIISYTANAHIGGFIGSVGVEDYASQKTINITIDGGKLNGKIYYIFDDVLSSAGAIIGGTHIENSAMVTLNITSSTIINKDIELIKHNLMGSRVSVVSSVKISDDYVGEGDYNLYNKDYFLDAQYFNQDYAWSESEISRISFSVIFKDEDGTVLDIVYLNPGEISVSTSVVPTKNSSVQFNYIFAGWDIDLTNINKNMVAKPVYNRETRSYNISYVDEKGNIIETKSLKYGSYVNQKIKAPEKKGNFFVSYKFVRWGTEGQTVTGELTIKPIYKSTLTLAAKIIITIVVLTAFGGMVYLVNKKKLYN